MAKAGGKGTPGPKARLRNPSPIIHEFENGPGNVEVVSTDWIYAADLDPDERKGMHATLDIHHFPAQDGILAPGVAGTGEKRRDKRVSDRLSFRVMAHAPQTDFQGAESPSGSSSWTACVFPSLR